MKLWIVGIFQKCSFLQPQFSEWDPKYVEALRHPSCEPRSDFIRNLVEQQAKRILKDDIVNLSPTEVYNVMKTLKFISQDVVETYLKKFVPGDWESLGFDSWRQLVVHGVHESGFCSLLPCIFDCLKRFADTNYGRGTAKQFFKDLLQFAKEEFCPVFPCSRTSNSKEQCQKFAAFLTDFLKLTCDVTDLRLYVPRFLESMTADCCFAEALIDSYCEAVAVCSGDERGYLSSFMPIVCDYLTKLSTKTRQTVQMSDVAAWHLVADFTRHYKPTSWKPYDCNEFSHFAKLQHSEKLPSNTDRSIGQYVTALDQWVSNMRDHLNMFNDKLLRGSLTVEQLRQSCAQFNLMKNRYDAFGCTLCRRKEAEQQNQQLQIVTEVVNGSVFYGQMDDFIELLDSWQVYVDSKIRRLLEDNMENESSSDSRTPLKFKDHVTVSTCSDVSSTVESWVKPIAKNRDFLCYFTVNESVIFENWLKEEVEAAKVLSSSVQPRAKSRRNSPFASLSIWGHDDNDDFEDEPLLTIQDFNDALEAVRHKLEKLLNRTATFEQLQNIRPMMKEFGSDDRLHTELELLVQFQDFSQRFEVTAAANAIRDMFALFRYQEVIKKLVQLQEKYRLCQWEDDETYKKLNQTCRTLEDQSTFSKMTTIRSSELRSELDEQLLKVDLDILYRLLCQVEKSTEFYAFVDERQFYTQAGIRKFKLQLEFVSSEFKDEDLESRVLDNVAVALDCIAPFVDKKLKFSEVLKQLKESGALVQNAWIDHLKSANANVGTVCYCFSQALTKGNITGRELEAILDNGRYVISFVSSTTKPLSSEETMQQCRLDLEFTINSLRLNPPTDVALFHAHGNVEDLLGSDPDKKNFEARDERRLDVHFSKKKKQFSPRLEVHTSFDVAKVDDFIRRLGLIDEFSHKDRPDNNLGHFLRVNRTVRDIFHTYQRLRFLRHPQYKKQREAVSYNLKECSSAGLSDDWEALREELRQWQQEIDQTREINPSLLCLGTRRILVLAEALERNDATAVGRIISTMFCNNDDCLFVLDSKVHELCNKYSAESIGTYSSKCTLRDLGEFIEQLVHDTNLKEFFCPTMPLRGQKTDLRKVETIHFTEGFGADETFRLLLHIFGGCPMWFEFLRCSPSTNLETLDLFLQCIQNQLFSARTFALVQIEQLTPALQARLIDFQLDSTKSGSVRVHYIAGSPSRFSDMAAVLSVQRHYETSALMSRENAVDICHEKVFCSGNVDSFEVVYGQAAVGKSHYILRQLQSSEVPFCTIAVNESFEVTSAIDRLNRFGFDHGGGIYFNITLALESPVLDSKVRTLLTEFNWFLCHMFVVGCVNDPKTELLFRMPPNRRICVYVEVPSCGCDFFVDTSKNSLDTIFELVPILRYLGNEQHITANNNPMEIGNNARLVCKYLLGYQKKDSHGRKIIDLTVSQLSKEKDPEIPFFTDPDVNRRMSDDECRQILSSHMPKNIFTRMISRLLFVNYMRRRCEILDKMSFFRRNSGGAPKVDGKGGVAIVRNLGSTLMQLMLGEVEDCCSPEPLQTTAEHPHQQLVYDFKDQQFSFEYVSLDSNALSECDRRRLNDLRIEIVPPHKITSKSLERFLAQSLSLPLKNGRLAIIEERNYVLTPDYTIKMININERRLSGMPVVLQGETGVGKTTLVRMLSDLWLQSLLETLSGTKRGIADVLLLFIAESQGPPELIKTLQDLSDSLLTETGLLRSDQVLKACQNCNDKILQVLIENASKPAAYLLDFDRSFILKAKDRNSPHQTAALFREFCAAKPWQTFYEITLRPSMTSDEIVQSFIPAIATAKRIPSTDNQFEDEIPAVVVFLDEINTSNCLGLLKEIVVDRTLDGGPLPRNLFVIAACNPHRSSISVIRRNDSRQDWTMAEYYVKPLPPTIRCLLWDYGALDEVQESHYIRRKLEMLADPFQQSPDLMFLCRLISKCQSMIRSFTEDKLLERGIDNVKERCRSCVSQRDIQRVLTLAKFFNKCKEADVAARRISRKDVLAAIGVVYYLRLDEEYRKIFCKELKDEDIERDGQSFLQVFQDTMDFFVANMDIPVGISMTLALKENLFATLACTVCKIPLIIVGPPGSSKTLSVNLIARNLQGAESPTAMFRNKLFPALRIHHHQCSRRSNPDDVDRVFARAIKEQNDRSLSATPVLCVVFMDEAGLPKRKRQSLKSLHHHLDDPQVAFIALSNRVLDAAKSNRAINLFRDNITIEDLEELAFTCLHVDRKRRPQTLKTSVENICKAYVKIMEDAAFRGFFGLRDFIHCLSHVRSLRSKSSESKRQISDLHPQELLFGLERNFNGLPRKDFQRLATIFLNAIGSSLEEVKLRNTVDILKESLNDRSSLFEGGESEMPDVRYKLIVDETADDSMTRLLFSQGILDTGSTKFLRCSKFPGDGELQKIHIISSVRHAARVGDTVILSETDDINDCLFDLFNQTLSSVAAVGEKKVKSCFYAYIAIGSVSKKCQVSRSFQCIVHVGQNDVYPLPLPFLSRFEKYRISPKDVLQAILNDRPEGLRLMVSIASKHVRDFCDAVGNQNLCGFKESGSSVESLFLDLLSRESCHQVVNQGLEELQEHSEGACSSSFSTLGYSESFYPEDWRASINDVIKHMEEELSESFGFKFSNLSDNETLIQSNYLLHVLDDRKVLPVECAWSGQRELSKNPANIRTWLKNAAFLSTPNIADAPEAAFAAVTVVHWMVFRVLTRLMQIATPAAIVESYQRIPRYYTEWYIEQQHHFSLPKTVKSAITKMSFQGSSKYVCFTRSSATTQSILRLAQSKAVFHNDVIDSVSICFLRESQTEEDIRSWLRNRRNKVLLLVANIDSCTRQLVNHARSLIDNDHKNTALSGQLSVPPSLCIVLLEISPTKTISSCGYPSLFLHGWEHVYLDHLGLDERHPIDVNEWFRVWNLYDKPEIDTREIRARFLLSLEQSLSRMLRSVIPPVVSRVVFGTDESSHLNRNMNAREREKRLRMLLGEAGRLKHMICNKFAEQWTSKFVFVELTRLACDEGDNGMYRNSLCERLHTLCHNLFVNFVSMTVFDLNQKCNMDLLLEQPNNRLSKLLFDLYEVLPVRNLAEIKLCSHTFRILYRLQVGADAVVPEFPFFDYVYNRIEKLLDESIQEVDKETQLLRQSSEEPKRTVSPGTIEHNTGIVLRRKLQCHSRDAVLVACKAVMNDRTLWQFYVQQFFRVKLDFRFPSEQQEQWQDMMQSLVLFPATDEIAVDIARLHTSARFHQLEIMHGLELWKTLDNLSGSATNTVPMEKVRGRPAEILATAIQFIPDALARISTCCSEEDAGSQLGNLVCNYETMRTLLPASVWYRIPGQDKLQQAVQIIHVVFAFLNSLKIGKVPLGKSCKFIKEMLTILDQMTCKATVNRILELGLSGIHEIVLKDQMDSCQNSSCKSFIDDTLRIYFPYPASVHCLEKSDCEWLIRTLDSQMLSSTENPLLKRHLRSSIGMLLQCFYNALVSGLGKKTIPDKEENWSFSTEVCKLVENQLEVSQPGCEELRYFPFFYPPDELSQREAFNVRPIAHAFFLCSLKLYRVQNSTKGFVPVWEQMNNKYLEIQSADPQSLLKTTMMDIERESFLHVFIWAFARLVPDKIYQGCMDETTIGTVNRVLMDEDQCKHKGRRLAFFYHLLGETRSLDRASSYVTRHKGTFPWMADTRLPLGKMKTRRDMMRFPCDVTGQLKIIEVEAAFQLVVQKISRNEQEEEHEAVENLIETSNRWVDKDDTKCRNVRVLLWNFIYHSLHEENLRSPALASRLVEGRFLVLNQCQSHLMSYFAQTSSSEEEDPLWKFFFCQAKGGANLSLKRVVFSLMSVTLWAPEQFRPWQWLERSTDLTTDAELPQLQDVKRQDVICPVKHWERLHSDFVFLFCNYANLSMYFLSQTRLSTGCQNCDRKKRLRGQCLERLKDCWDEVTESLFCSCEERTLFMSCLLSECFKNYSTGDPHGRQLSKSFDECASSFYEKVFLETWRKFQNPEVVAKELGDEEYMPLFKNFSACFPLAIDYQYFMFCLRSKLTIEGSAVAQSLDPLCNFVLLREQLRYVGRLLPDVIYFYQWLHTRLAHEIPEEIQQATIKDLRTVTKLSKETGKSFQLFLGRILKNFDGYRKLRRKQVKGVSSEVYELNNNTKLTKVISSSEADPGILFVVATELIDLQNQFLTRLSEWKQRHCSYHHVARSPCHPMELITHPTYCLAGDVTAQELESTRRSNDDRFPEGREFEQIIQRYCHYNFLDKTAKDSFDFHRLQQCVLDTFVTGKPNIQDASCMLETVQPMSSTRDCTQQVIRGVDVQSVRRELPKQFQVELSDTNNSLLRRSIYSSDYSLVYETAVALRTVAGFLCQEVLLARDVGPERYRMRCDELHQLRVSEFLQQERVYGSKKESDGRLVGIGRSSRRCIEQLPLCQLYATLQLYASVLDGVEALEGHLPQELRTPLAEHVKQSLPDALMSFDEMAGSQKAGEALKVLDEKLSGLEALEMVQHSKCSLADLLVQQGHYSEDNVPFFLSDEILVENYVEVFRTLRTVLNKLQQPPPVRTDDDTLRCSLRPQWSGVIHSLWDDIPFLRPNGDMEPPGDLTEPLPFFDLDKEGLNRPVWPICDVASDSQRLGTSSSEESELDKPEESLTSSYLRASSEQSVSEEAAPPSTPSEHMRDSVGHQRRRRRSHRAVDGGRGQRYPTHLSNAHHHTTDDRSASMTVEDVVEFLKSKKLDLLTSKIRDDDINGDLLQKIGEDEEMLREVCHGQSAVTRGRLQLAIEELFAGDMHSSAQGYASEVTQSDERRKEIASMTVDDVVEFLKCKKLDMLISKIRDEDIDESLLHKIGGDEEMLREVCHGQSAITRGKLELAIRELAKRN